MLAYYAREFAFTEVNSTYYRIPPPQVFARLAEVTPECFVFTVKAHGSLTHERDQGPGANAAKFIAALAPLRAAGKLGAVLFQFPYSFRKLRENEDYLARLRDAFSGTHSAVEFRNAGWAEQSTWELLRTLGFAYVCVDEPALKGLIGPISVRTNDFAYVRFHGRNAAKWWRHDEPWERYDFLYSEAELAEWVPRVRTVAEGADRAFIAFNNHPRGQAVQNARAFRTLLDDNMTA
jgi:uncharacterized protein YecE (DUF72 family)